MVGFLYGTMFVNGLVVVGLLYWNWRRGNLAAIDDTSELLRGKED